MFPKKRLKTYSFWVVALLTIFFISIQVSNHLIWNLNDFLKIALVLIGIIVSIEISIVFFKKGFHRFLFVIFAIFLIIAIWAELQANFFSNGF